MTRLGTTRFRQVYSITAVAIAPNDKEILTQATESDKVIIRVWDSNNGELRRSFAIHPSPLASPVLTPDGKLLAAVCADGLYFWSGESGKVLKRLPVNPKARRVTFSPRGRYVALCGDGLSIEVRQTASGKAVAMALNDLTEGKPSTSPNADILSVDFSADERYLVLGRPWYSPLVWDLQRNELVRAFRHQDESSGHLALTKDGGEILTIEDDQAGKRTISLQETLTGKLISHHPLPGPVQAHAFSRDRRLAALLVHSAYTSGTEVHLVDTRSGRQVGMIRAGDGIKHLIFSSDGKTLITGGAQSLRSWSTVVSAIESPPELAERFPATAPYRPVVALAFGASDSQLLSGGGDGLLVWNVPLRRPQQVLIEGHRSDGTSNIAVAGDRASLVTTQSGVTRWTCREGKWTLAGEAVRGPSLFDRIAYSPDGSFLALGSTIVSRKLPRPSLAVVDRDGAPIPLRSTLTPVLPRISISALAFSADSQRLAIAEGGYPDSAHHIHILDIRNSGQVTATFDFPGERVECLAFSPNGQHLVVGGGDAHDVFGSPTTPTNGGPPPKQIRLILVNTSTAEALHSFTCEERVLLSLAYSPDGTLIAAGSLKGRIYILRAADLTPIKTLEGGQGATCALAFSPSGNLLATSHSDTTILLWDAQAFRPNR